MPKSDIRRPGLLPFRQNWGSTAALILGAMLICTAKPDLAIAGVIAVLGALAFRSAKIRRAIGAALWLRVIGEVAAVAVILFLWLAKNNLKVGFETNPVPNVIIPAWSILAYLAAAFPDKPKS